MISMPILILACLTVVLVDRAAFAAEFEDETEAVLFQEGFEDGSLLQRGWYDGRRFKISGGAYAGNGCIE